MIESTLCYLEQDGKYLMLYRNKKKQDPNAGKWIGVGGKLEAGETPEECVVREVREETGYDHLISFEIVLNSAVPAASSISNRHASVVVSTAPICSSLR